MDELLPGVGRLANVVTLPPRKEKGWVHELKVSLSESESLRYETRHPNGDGVVAFNIHHHHGREVAYFAREDQPTITGTFHPPAPGDYYLMWENRSAAPVPVTYVVERIPSPR